MIDVGRLVFLRSLESSELASDITKRQMVGLDKNEDETVKICLILILSLMVKNQLTAYHPFDFLLRSEIFCLIFSSFFPVDLRYCSSSSAALPNFFMSFA